MPQEPLNVRLLLLGLIAAGLAGCAGGTQGYDVKTESPVGTFNPAEIPSKIDPTAPMTEEEKARVASPQ